MTALPTIAVTIGEPAGIGPDLCVRLAERAWPARLVFVGDIELLRERARRLGAGVCFGAYVRRGSPASGMLEVAHFPVAAPVVAGRPDRSNARAVVATLEAAITGALSGEFAAMVTAPVQKSVLNDAGIAFTGHTEFLAARTRTPHVVMLLVGGSSAQTLRVALATTHLPLAAVPAAITRESLTATLAVVAADLAGKFGIVQPRIAVCGLNPHAGEGGHLGREEIEVIAPVIASLRGSGLDLAGPLPADTVFVPAHLREYDCVVAMYHDQGLPVLKHASFGHGVNVTLGVPIVRTSVDHGTALDLAANGAGARGADPGSLFAAVNLAIELAGKRHHA
ncbi:MAG TPA: 4-hydroxythreonine-4-phosphate dehydrogenase PdxA [Casimicrobiaceae bacterium]|jgi:4-hydroxythreonine-4-phosphate dehydrogenase|nr:4-hydroxythreonine-4-phosphate dehydrogenase PdxA [Casimicrobiaceae bacterium]